ncbi:hypothetical protein [Agromyces sp. SYSU T00266]|uniref:hypothetical protein n=1 Tax=Agromyces zhanjiangensis TaxID=3158562 RepID=UPI003394BE87
MVLRFPDHPEVQVTTDVDAAYQPRPEIDEVIAEMADDLGLPDRWMNAASAPWNVVADTGGTITVATAEEWFESRYARVENPRSAGGCCASPVRGARV